MSESERPRHPLEGPSRQEREAEVMHNALREGRAVRLVWPTASLQPILTWGLLALIVLIFSPYLWRPKLYEEMLIQGALYWPAVVKNGEWWRLVTSIFLHADLGHIAMNGLSLYYLGNNLEVSSGRVRYLIIFILSGLAGSVLQLGLGDHRSWGVGASGAVFGMAGAVLLFLWQHRRYFPSSVRQSAMQMVLLLGLQLALGFAIGQGIGNWAHLGGLIMGLACAWWIGPVYIRPKEEPQTGPDGIQFYVLSDTKPLSGRRWLGVLFLFGVLLVGVLLLNQGA
jgi:rhomboid protease GluP